MQKLSLVSYLNSRHSRKTLSAILRYDSFREFQTCIVLSSLFLTSNFTSATLPWRRFQNDFKTNEEEVKAFKTKINKCKISERQFINMFS